MNFKCNRCGKTFPISGSFAGHAVPCPKCKEGNLVPAFHHKGEAPPEGAEAAPAAPALKPHRVKRPLATVRDPSGAKGFLSEKVRTILVLVGIVAGCLLAIALLVLYPILRNPRVETEKPLKPKVQAPAAPANEKEKKPAEAAVPPAVQGKVLPADSTDEKTPPPAETGGKESAPPPAQDPSAAPADDAAKKE